MAFRMDIDRYDVRAAVPGTKRSFELNVDIGTGVPLTLPVLQIDGAKPGKTLLVLSGVHGDEYEGVETVLRLYRELEPERLTGSIVLVPQANPLSYRGGTRTSPEDGLNMARVFPGQLEGMPTERIAWQLHHRFIAKADFMLDLHSGGTHYAVSTLVGYYHNDRTELGRRCREAAEAFGIELLWAHESIAPGRSVSSALELGVPWLYTEAYGGRRIRREDADAFLEGAYRLLRHLSMLAPDAHRPSEAADHGGDAGEETAAAAAAADTGQGRGMQPALRRIYGDGNFDGSETAEADGFFIPGVPLSSAVEAGTAIGAIYGFDGQELHRVVAARAGVVVMLPGTPAVRKSEPLFMIAPTQSEMK
ncbi:M14 family metallopeptidase [Paenibacillus hodogayensis]|uniref:M14 family metallopeptidase n=1 Tax=Paenibacillus hodogayensis TaxID=279208 RepID=A0ABV5VTV7_9BACL